MGKFFFGNKNNGISIEIKKQITNNTNDDLEYETKVMKDIESSNLFPRALEKVFLNGEIYII